VFVIPEKLNVIGEVISLRYIFFNYNMLNKIYCSSNPLLYEGLGFILNQFEIVSKK